MEEDGFADAVPLFYLQKLCCCNVADLEKMVFKIHTFHRTDCSQY